MMNFPRIMCTQHPDSAIKYVSTQKELDEAIECFQEYGCDEYMPDYEGKTTPYHQNVQIITRLLEETKLRPGKDVFITPRIPSAIQENAFRQMMVMMSVAEANWKARECAEEQAIIELVHPMIKNISELVEAQQCTMNVTNLAKKEFKFEMNVPQIIPLLEEVPSLLAAARIVERGLSAYEKNLDMSLERYRAFIGKSDSALLFGHMASALACKHAISSIRELEQKIDTTLGIIFGGGALPFRGHITLENAENVFKEYAGIDTITLQSGLRYDHGIDKAKEFVKLAKSRLPSKARIFQQDEKEEMVNIIGIFGKNYIHMLYQIANIVNRVADLLPDQRDRLTREGIIGYSRDISMIEKVADLCRADIGKGLLNAQCKESLNLPRAIKYTGALYSMGLPPEFLGTGDGIVEIIDKLGDEALESLLLTYYPSLEADLNFSSKFLNLNVARVFFPERTFEQIERNVDILSNHFDISIGGESTYKALTEMAKPYLTDLLNKKEHILDDESLHLTKKILLELGKIRGSLG